MSSRTLARAAGTLLCAALASLASTSCDPAVAAPAWVSVGALPDVVVERSGKPSFTGPDGRVVRVARGEDATWLETTLYRADWSPAPSRPNAWVAPVPVLGIGRPTGGPPERLASEGRTFRYVGDFAGGAEELARANTPGAFFTAFGMVQVLLGEGEEPPLETTIGVFAHHQSEAEGELRIIGRRYSGTGISLAPGERARVRLPASRSESLRFATCVEPALADASGDTLFRVRLGDETLFQHRVTHAEEGSCTWHELPLPSIPAGGGELSLEVDGAFAYASFLAPSLGPTEAGRPNDRPWGRARPDLVLFLADTLRADALSCYGNPIPLTPNLDRMAREGTLFERAWAPSTWTLPSHSALFTGLQPHQTTAVGSTAVLPAELTTIAEVLRAAGYRTGAATEAIFVSQRHGMEQGFEWFSEHHGEIETTIAEAEAFIEADDGRPTFLFVHTYHAHSPYVVGPETRERFGAELGLDFPEDFDELFAAWHRHELTAEHMLDDPLAAELIRKQRALYLGGVADLDRAFGGFVESLEARGLFEEGYLVFTSDHGEAFGEHEEVYHSGSVYEEQLAIPLIVRGPGLDGGVNSHNASLVDLAPTLAHMARVPNEPAWLGTSLLELAGERPIFAFHCRESGTSGFAVREGDRKIIGWENADSIERRELFAAFRLDRDPLERANLAGGEATWPSALLERTASAVLRFLQPVVGARAVTMDRDALRELEELGYGGSD